VFEVAAEVTGLQSVASPETLYVACRGCLASDLTVTELCLPQVNACLSPNRQLNSTGHQPRSVQPSMSSPKVTANVLPDWWSFSFMGLQAVRP